MEETVIGGDALSEKLPRSTRVRPEARAARRRIVDTEMVLAQARREGRPPEYHESFCESAFKVCLLGATNDQLAAFFDVTPPTIHNWNKAHPEFFSAVTRGKRAANADVAHGLYLRGRGFEREAVKIFQHEGQPVYAPYTEYYPPDPTAALNFLKNREPELWRDRREVTGKDGSPLIPSAGEMLDDLIEVFDRMASRIGAEPGRANGHARPNGAANGTGALHG